VKLSKSHANRKESHVTAYSQSAVSRAAINYFLHGIRTPCRKRDCRCRYPLLYVNVSFYSLIETENEATFEKEARCPDHLM